MKSISLVVLAAGIGSRYGGLKQMDPVGPSGEFILDYSVFDALQSGFERVVFVIRKDIERDFRKVMGHRIEQRVDTVYVNQELTDLPSGFRVPPARQKPWGTGHAVLSSRDVVDGPFAVINADDFYGRDAYRVLGRHLDQTRESDSEYAMVGFTLRNTLSEHGSVARGICRANEDDTLREVVERTKIEKVESGARYLDDDGVWVPLTGDELVSMNMWGFKPGIFAHLSTRFRVFLESAGNQPKAEFFVPSVVNELIDEGVASVRVLPCSSRWFGVTYPQDKEVVVREIRRQVDAGDYPGALWAGSQS